MATRFAPYAAVAAGNLYAPQSARDMAENLQTALESRAVIGQAKGILMERHKHRLPGVPAAGAGLDDDQPEGP